MEVEKQIRKLIREAISNLLETESFDYESAENMAVTNSQHNVYPHGRRGIEPWFNYWDELNSQEEDKERQDGQQPDQNVEFDSPRPNYGGATVRTNIYEEVDDPIMHTGNYISPQPNPIQGPLDAQSVFPGAFINTSKISDDMRKEVDYFNDNIAREFELVPVADDRWQQKPPMNRSRSW